ncbi:quinoprotein relay system zinc metallohydrolase 2 [Candidatus Methylospira mobilis]|nr:quinoprotein relay system zinc metallohydrolase 2 [Candidatus Methylospira mobilis]WNV03631.1 quinoprotein relay system zinc metallohydrolase 2 [Candidatus Methylospira mobilis]
MNRYRRQWHIILLGVLWGICCASAPAAAPLELMQVAEGIFVHQGRDELPDTLNHGEIANIGFVAGTRCVAIIDSGGSPEQGRALKVAVEALSPLPVCYVINTHVHPDHIYGNRAFALPGVHFVGHRKLAQAMSLRAGYYLENAGKRLNIVLEPADFIPPDIAVDDALKLDLGGRTLRLTAHAAAHTDSDLTVYDEKTQTLWAADLLFMTHVPVVDGSVNGWLAELAKLRAIPARHAIPGHGPVSADWPAASDAELGYLEMLRAEIREYIRQGKTMEAAMNGIGLSARRNWQLFDEFHKRNISTAFAELEWE